MLHFVSGHTVISISLSLSVIQAVLGASREQRRDIYCSSMASQIMDLAVGRGFVKKYFDPTAKSEVCTYA